MTKLVTEYFKTHAARQLIESVNESSNSTYYMFAAKSDPFTDDQNPPSPNTSYNGTHYDLYDELLFGKRLGSSDVAHMIRRVDWTSGNTYVAYSPDNANLHNENFYVVSQEGTDYHIFKCLDNNGNTAANDQPLFSETAADDEYYATNDGYQWKYMYKINETNWNKFATNNYAPIIVDANVTSNAVSGALEVIRIENGGGGYNAYANGTIKEAAVSGNSLLFALQSTSSTLSANTDFYKNSQIYITSGTGAGQVRTISEYIVTGNERRVLVTSAFSVLPDTTSAFDIGPGVTISGDGTGCVAHATINTTANSIQSFSIINRGQGYSWANVTLSSNTGGGSVMTANITPIISPEGGHGSDIINELFAKRVCFSGMFSNSESNTIPTSNDYRKIGILKDPKFANLEITLTTSDAGSFIDGETVIHYVPQSTNSLLQTFTYTLSRYQTLQISSNANFEVGDPVSFEQVSGNVLSSNSTHANIRLGVSSDAFTSSTKVGDGTVTRTISSIDAASPAVVVTANAHGLANASSVVFANVTGTAIDDDATPTTYYAKVINSTAFSIYEDSGLSTPFDNSANSSATDGYVSNGTRIHTLTSVAYTFTGNNDPILGHDDNNNIFGYKNEGSNLPLSIITKQNSTVRTSTTNSSSFTLDNITLTPSSDVIVAEVYSSQESILNSDFVDASTGIVSNRAGSILRLSNVNGQFATGHQIKGLTSNTIATVSTLDRSFETFNQLTEMAVQITSTGIGQGGIGNTGFIFDDVVLQANTFSSGKVFSVSNTITRYVSSITATNPAIGTTSVSHGFANGQSISFNNLNGTNILEANSYFAETINSTAFTIYTDSGLSTALDNSANSAANSGTVTSSGTGSFGTNSYRSFFLTGIKGNFSVSDDSSGVDHNFVSNSSGATAKITSKIEPDLVDGSGEFLYVENLIPIERTNEQSERIKIIFEF